MKKIISIIIILSMCIGIVTGCQNQQTEDISDNKELTKNPSENIVDGMELMKKSSEYYKGLDSYELEQVMNMTISYIDPMVGQLKNMDTTMQVNTSIFNDPYKFKNISLLKYEKEEGDISSMGIPDDAQMEQYGVKEGDNVNVYQLLANQWYKTTLSLDDFIRKDTQGVNYITNYDKFIQEVKSVTEEIIDDVNINSYKVDFVIKPEYKIELFEQYGYASYIEEENVDARNKIILKTMEDITFTVWFNKEDNTILRVFVNLTPMMPEVGKLIADSMSSDNEVGKQQTIAMYNKAKIDNNIKIKNINNCDNFEVPSEALKAPGL